MDKTHFSREIEIPEGVTVKSSNGIVTVKSKNSEVSKKFKFSGEQIKIEGGKILLSTRRMNQSDKKMIGTVESHIKNMIKGVAEGHKYILKICSGHFPMNVSYSNGKLTIKNFLGEKKPRVLNVKQGVNVKVEGDHITVEGADKDLASQVSASIEQLTRRPGFDTRVFMDGIYIISKDGTELK